MSARSRRPTSRRSATPSASSSSTRRPEPLATEQDSAVAALSALIAELPDDLRCQALTHSSWTERRVDSYERLAFLGDSVLGLSVASE
ncbi:MAG: ribonuclease III, partial [Solirubrobacterales bacterium]